MIALFVLFIAGCGKNKLDDRDLEGRDPGVAQAEFKECVEKCLDKKEATQDACAEICRPKNDDQKPPLRDGEKPSREGLDDKPPREGMDDKPPLEKDVPPKEVSGESDDAPAAVEDVDDDNLDVDLGDVI